MPAVTTRCIFGRPSIRTEGALRKVTEAVIALCKEKAYREVAMGAIKAGGYRVFVPAALDEQNIDATFEGMEAPESYGNTDGEPCYPNVEAGNAGKNQDGTAHRGYLVIDVIERLVVDLVDRDGKTKLRTPLVRFANAEQVRF